MSTEAQRQAKKRYYEKNKDRQAARAKTLDGKKKSEEAVRRYRQKHPEKVQDQHLRRSYGISLNEYDALFLKQGESCAACGATEPRGGRWHIDHSHEAGTIRGILCANCNMGIGQADDCVDRLLDWANYLRQRSD